MDESAELGGTTVMTDWFDLEATCTGDVYIAFYKKIVVLPAGAAAYSDTVVTREQVEGSAWCARVAGDCQVHGLAVDDAAGKLYFGYLNTVDGYDTWAVRRCNLDGSSPEVVISHVFYEREEYGQYIADLALDLLHRDFYIVGYLANSGGRSLYRVPMDHGALPGVACMWGYSGSCTYLGAGEAVLVGNCDAAAYAEGVKGAGMGDNCAPGWLTRYPASGSGDVAVVPAASAATSSAGARCAAIPAPVREADACGTAAVPVPEADRRVFFGYDRDLGWLDTGAGELRQLWGPGLVTWCGATTCYPYDSNEAVLSQVAYNAYTSVSGPAVDRARHRLYYIACSGGLCSHRDPATGECTDVTTQLCGEYTLARYDWLTGETTRLWTANRHDFPGPDVFAQHLLAVAFDPATEQVYWATRYRNHDGSMLFARLGLQGRDVAANPVTTCDVEVFSVFGGYEGASTGGSSVGGGGGGATTLSDTDVFPADGDTAITGGWLGLEVSWVCVCVRACSPSRHRCAWWHRWTAPGGCGSATLRALAGSGATTRCCTWPSPSPPRAVACRCSTRATSRGSPSTMRPPTCASPLTRACRKCLTPALPCPALALSRTCVSRQLLHVRPSQRPERDSACRHGRQQRRARVQPRVLRVFHAGPRADAGWPGVGPVQPPHLCHHVRVCAVLRGGGGGVRHLLTPVFPPAHDERVRLPQVLQQQRQALRCAVAHGRRVGQGGVSVRTSWHRVPSPRCIHRSHPFVVPQVRAPVHSLRQPVARQRRVCVRGRHQVRPQ